MDRTIKFSITEAAMRQSIDMAVHGAMERFKGRFGDDEELVYRIAKAAAQSAVEQFQVWANANIRLIDIDMEHRAERAMLHPARLTIEGLDIRR